MTIELIECWTSLTNGGDGSAHNKWYLTEDLAKAAQEAEIEWDSGWAEECIEMVETYIGSNIHKMAVANGKELE